MKYLYFVSYSWFSEKQRGYGNREYRMHRTINSIKDTKKISKWIEETQKDAYGNKIDVAILSYSLIKKSRGYFS